MSEAPEILYVNASTSAPDVITDPTDGSGPPVLYSDTRATPIVASASDYRATIARFQCTRLDLPVLSPSLTTDTLADQPSVVDGSMPLSTNYLVGVGVRLPLSNTVQTNTFADEFVLTERNTSLIHLAL
jgi:hypothetical protein